jgi:hypothetical protein
VNTFTGADGTARARLLLRADKTQRLVLNVALFDKMDVAIQGEKYLRFVSAPPAPVTYLLKHKSKLEAEEVLAAVSKCKATLQ